MISKTNGCPAQSDYPSICLQYGKKSSSSEQRSLGQHTLFLFTCRWTCSRCWKAALMIGSVGHELQQRNVAVVMVGSTKYLRQATHLAASLKLPVTLLGDDNHALRKSYGLKQIRQPCLNHALMLVDSEGGFRFCQQDFLTRDRLYLGQIISALDEGPKDRLSVVKNRTC